MKRNLIAELSTNQSAKISGFVEKLRDTRYMVFVILKDTSGQIQVSIDKELQKNLVEESLTAVIGSVVTFEGAMKENSNVKMGGIEFIPTSIRVESIAEASPIDETSSLDQRLNFRWVDLRTKKNTLMFKAQSCFSNALRQFLVNENFVEIHSPKIIGAESESGAGVFEVKYFDAKAFLAQSPQFYKQMAMASGFDRIFECGPVFRAEKSNTNRHATEFTGFDLEFSYIESYEEVMQMEENLIVFALSAVKEKFGEEIKDVFGVEVNVPTLPFPRMKLADLYLKIKEKYGYDVPECEKGDLTTEAERLVGKYASETFGHEFMFVTDYDAKNRAFYHMRKNGVPQGYDLIWKGVEITTGAQREHRYEILKQQAIEKGLGKDVEFYLDFFRYGCPPHGGFGIGIDRITMLLLGVPTIKEAQFIFRGPNRLNP
ncbi:MAG: aspartate--tRNA(Asn) ligase [Clostridia bacterium]